MEIETYFFDTYAFHEIIVGNKAYLPYKNCAIITTKMNLMELYYSLLNKYNKEKADLHYDFNLSFCAEITNEVIKEAMVFRSQNKNKKLSYVDCLGYTMAKRIGIKFLTGDKEFENLDNVKFIK